MFLRNVKLCLRRKGLCKKKPSELAGGLLSESLSARRLGSIHGTLRLLPVHLRRVVGNWSMSLRSWVMYNWRRRCRRV